MADIKNYMKEKEKRQQNQQDYRDKIKKHRRNNVYSVLMVMAFLAIIVIVVYVQYKRHVYTDYDIVSSVDIESAEGTTNIRLGNSILTYSKDGAHCTNSKGEVTWNQTYEIQNVEISTCQNVTAIGSYNGRSIYVQSSDKQLGEITTTMPIRDIAVAANGNVTAVLADTDVTWVNTYNATGELLYYGQTHMHDSGYPAALGLSPNGELLAVSYVYVDAGTLKTNIAFYNFGSVGDNQSDNIVSAYSYTDMLIPYVQFMSNNTAFAVGDSRLMIYTGSQKPEETAVYLLDREIQSVYYNENYVGLVFLSDKAEAQYKLEVYSASGSKVGDYYFNTEYTDIFFEKDSFTIYNDTECLIMTFDGVEKFNGLFNKTAKLLLPTGTPYRYQMVTNNSIDTIQFK